jgi:hypothetical protein
MKTLSNILIALGLLLLLNAAVSRLFIGRPFALLGVRALSLIVLANTAFLLAILIKFCEKK